MNEASFLLIFFSCFVVVVVLFVLVFKNYFSGFKPKNNKVVYTNSSDINSIELKKISSRPFLFGLENKIISDDDLYFDEENLYVINKLSQKASFKLSEITELSKTSVRINNSPIWQIKIKQSETDITFKFAHNYTLWNKNFVLFHEKLIQINPEIVKSKWSFWRM